MPVSPSGCLRERDRNERPSWANSHKINHGENADPNNVERVPEQGEAEQTMLHTCDKSHHRHLHHHHHEPDQSEGDVHPVAADKREEGGQKGAALRRRAASDHIGEFVNLECKKRSSERKSDQGTQIHSDTISRIDCERHQSAGVARDEQAGGFDCDRALIEQLGAGRTTCRGVHEYRVARKERGEHDDVAQQEDPEAVSDHNPLWERPRFTCAWKRRLRDAIDCDGDVHAAAPACWARSNSAICSAGTSNSVRPRDAKMSSGTNAPKSPKPAIHQMCQIIAKPIMTAKNALTKPVALFFGISIDSYSRNGPGSSCFACSRRLLVQKASVPLTFGAKAKFHAGGGDAVAHSSVRPFQGSAVTRSLSRARIDTTSCTIWQTIPPRITTAPSIATTSQGCHARLS